MKINITVLLLGIRYNTYESSEAATLPTPPPTVDLCPALLDPPPATVEKSKAAILNLPPEAVLESDRLW